MLRAVLDRKRARDRGHSPVRLDSQLAKNFDASAAAMERVRPDVEIEALLLFGLGTAPERVRLLKQANALSISGQKRRGC